MGQAQPRGEHAQPHQAARRVRAGKRYSRYSCYTHTTSSTRPEQAVGRKRPWNVNVTARLENQHRGRQQGYAIIFSARHIADSMLARHIAGSLRSTLSLGSVHVDGGISR